MPSGPRCARHTVRTILAVLFVTTAARAHGASQFSLLDALPALPTPAASSGFVYRFDPDTNAFLREPEVTGQVYVERPMTLGRGVWNLNVGYQWSHLDRLNGHQVSPGLEVHEAIVGATYGVTDDFELNLTVPVFSFGSAPFVEPIYLRAKYRVVDRPDIQAAIGVTLRLFTELPEAGNSSVFDGRAQSGLFLYAAGPRQTVTRTVFVQPYVNVGLDCDDSGTSDLEVRWALGVDMHLTNRVTAAAAVLAVHRPLISVEAMPVIAQNTFDASIGGRFFLWRDRLVGVLNLAVPLNDAGLRADIVPFAGIEAIF